MIASFLADELDLLIFDGLVVTFPVQTPDSWSTNLK